MENGPGREKMPQRIFLTILIFLCLSVSLILVCGFIRSQESKRQPVDKDNDSVAEGERADPSRGTYESAAFGFKINYPTDVLYAIGDSENGSTLKSFAVTKTQYEDVADVVVSLSPIAVSSYQDAKRQVEMIGDAARVTGPDKAEINGRIVHEVTYALYGKDGPGSFKGDGVYRTYYFSDFSLSFGYVNPEAEERFSAVEQAMLSSMELTNNLKIYSNEQYGFELKYPANWFSYDESGVVYIQPEEEKPEGIPGPHADALSIGRTEYAGESITDEAIQQMVGGVPYSTEGVKVGIENALEVRTACEGVGCGAPQWLVLKEGYLYHFDSNLGYSSDFDAILATFRFLF